MAATNGEGLELPGASGKSGIQISKMKTERSDQFLENPRRKKAHSNYFIISPCNSYFLSCLICLPQRFPPKFPAFFKLPALRLAPDPQRHTEKHPALTSLPHAPLLPHARLCFLLGIRTIWSQPWFPWGPELCREVLSLTLTGIYITARAGPFLPGFTQGWGSPLCETRLLLTPDSPCT